MMEARKSFLAVLFRKLESCRKVQTIVIPQKKAANLPIYNSQYRLGV